MTTDPAAGAAPVTSPAAGLVSSLRERRLTIATAESLTAGLISAAIADVPGASAVLRGGLSAYATEVKRECLSISAELIERHGVISPECAEAMAYQSRVLFGADLAISATGVAGPDQQEGQPVGTVFIAVATAADLQTSRLDLSGSRRAIRLGTVEAALSLAHSVVAVMGKAAGGHSSVPSGDG